MFGSINLIEIKYFQHGLITVIDTWEEERQ